MSDKFVLVVSDEGDGKHGEITVVDAAHEAERLVETLLEAGFEQDRIQVFTGSEAELVTACRPVVNLLDEADQTTEPARPVSGQAESEIVEVGAETERETVAAHSGKGNPGDEVRPSSVSRSARDDSPDLYISACEAAA